MAHTRKRLNKHVHSLVTILVPPSREHIKSIFKIEIIIPIKMTTNKFVNLRLGCRMKILEFVHRLELDDIQPVRKNTIRFALEEMFTLISGDMRNGGEHISAMGGRALNAVSVVNPALSGFVINIKVLKVVVKVDRTGAKVSSKQGSMGRENGRDIDMAFAAQRNGETSLPFMEVGDDGGGELTGSILKKSDGVGKTGVSEWKQYEHHQGTR
jgi:hypothetical protein